MGSCLAPGTAALVVHYEFPCNTRRPNLMLSLLLSNRAFVSFLYDAFLSSHIDGIASHPPEWWSRRYGMEKGLNPNSEPPRDVSRIRQNI
jgi:hypothetical protein